jgi:dihydroorotate dehydrogenase
VPLFLKIAPDLDDAQVGVIAATLKRLALDGVIATNTTIAARRGEGPAARRRAGGLSGGRCSNPATASSATCAARWAGFPIIGVGGVLSRRRRAKVEAGADLVQIYTGLIYRGPALVTEAARALAAALTQASRARNSTARCTPSRPKGTPRSASPLPRRPARPAPWRCSGRPGGRCETPGRTAGPVHRRC